MKVFLSNVFKKKGEGKKFLKKMKKLAKLSNEINQKQEELDDVEFQLMHEKKDEMYISLANFLELMNIEKLKVQDILTKCKHVSELDPKQSSTIEVHMVVEKGHIVLCPNTDECDIHKGYKGDKVKIVSVRK